MTALPFSHRFIVFDVDGTLIDSQHTVVHCMSAAFVAHGLPAPAAAAIRATIGLKLDIAIASLLPEPERSRAPHLVEDYRNAFFPLQATPEHAEALVPGTLEMPDSSVPPTVFLGTAPRRKRPGTTPLWEPPGR